MNCYEIEFHARCPTNGARIKYALRIQTPAVQMIAAELLVTAVEAIEAGEPIYHEDAADQLVQQFPGVHTLTADHHGVRIETTRTGASQHE